MSSFLSDHGALLAVVCALLAVAYGVVTTRSLLALSPGNETMQRLSAAIQEGAQAYLKRQYTVIGAVGVVLFIALIPLQNIEVAIGFADRRPRLRGGRLHRHERLGPRQRPRGRGGPRRHRPGAQRRLPRRRRHRHARRRPRAARRRRLLRDPHVDLRRRDQGGRGRAHRPRLRRLADLRLRPSGRRHLHQGRRRRRRHRRQDRGRHPGGRPAQPGRDRRQRGRQRRRLRRHGGRPLRDLRGHRGRRDAARRPDLPERHRGRALPAGPRRRLDHRVDHRHLRRQGRQRRARALPGRDPRRHHLRAALPPDHQLDDGRPAGRATLRRGPTSTSAR